MRKIALIVGGVFAVLIVAVLIAPRLIDFKPRIASAIQQATGRDFHIDGNLVITLIPNVEFSAAGIRMANAPGAKSAEMVRIGSIDGKIELWPLLTGRFVVDRLVITEPEANFEIDGAGQPNWEIKHDNTPGGGAQRETNSGSSFDRVQLGDVRIERGKFTYSDAASGQNLTGRDLNVAFMMPDLSRPFSTKISLILNEEPTTLDVSVDTPFAVMTGKAATVTAALENKHIAFHLGAKAVEGGGTGFGGTLDFNVPSVGQLAAWLGRPLDRGQPDPGALKMNAEFNAGQTGVVLKTATIQGTNLSATASGGVESVNGEFRKVTLKVEGGVLDIDRYLPKPAARPVAVQPVSTAGKSSPAGNADPLALLPDSKFDLAALRGKEVDIQIKLQGVKASGVEVGNIDVAAKMSGGKLDATIREVQLYSGKISGQTKLDASGDALAVDTKLTMDKVNVGALVKAAMAGGNSPIAGVATGTITASGTGASPRALAQGLLGNLDVDISGADMRDAAINISALKLAIALPGIDKQPTLKASAVYNRQPVTIELTTDTTRKLLGDNRFQVTATITSPLATAKYAGAVIRQPTPSLDGKFELAVASVGRLMSWIGMPLAQGQPDPGLLNVNALMTGEGGKATLKEARIEGKAIKVTATASFDTSKQAPAFDAAINVEQADLNAYLPAPAKQPAQPARRGAPQAQRAAGWSEEPIDVAFLSRANGKIEAQFKSIRYRDLVIDSGRAEGTLANGALKTSFQDVKFVKGSMNVSANLTAKNNALALDYQASLTGFQAQPLLVAFAGTDRLSGVAEFTAKGSASGRSQRDLIRTLNGEGSFKFLDGAIHGINIAATLRQAKTLGFDQSARETQKTDFAELSGTFVIRDGVLENKDLKMIAPILRLTGTGQVPMPPRTLDYNLTATLVATLEGQGGKEGLTGLPIPVRVTGGWDAPAYTVDWQGVFREAAKDPERLKSLPKDLQQTAKGLGVNIPGLGDTGKLPDVLQTLPGVLGGAKPASPDGGQNGQKAPAPDVGNALRNLLGR